MSAAFPGVAPVGMPIYAERRKRRSLVIIVMMDILHHAKSYGIAMLQNIVTTELRVSGRIEQNQSTNAVPPLLEWHRDSTHGGGRTRVVAQFANHPAVLPHKCGIAGRWR
jgi:hypothetical protein